MSGFTTNPGYYDLITGLYESLIWFYGPENMVNYTFPQGFIDDFRRYYYFETSDYLLIVYVGIIFTIIRYLFEFLICKPMLRSLKVDNKEKEEKIPECVWKVIAYIGFWLYCTYLIIYKYDYFSRPWLIWDDWEIAMPIPYDIRLLYFAECGFYLHSVYATLFMDAKRKDFLVSMLHHVLTMTLITVSYATRYHKIGLFVMFVHDITDILLEFAKCNTYLRGRNNKIHVLNDHIADISFAFFAAAWCLFRLYWFPLKVLYITGVVSVHRLYNRGGGLYALFNGLLWTLLLLDLYWFYFILVAFIKMLKGELRGDVRDVKKKKNENEQDKKND